MATRGCPCGYHGDNKQECLCSVFKVQKYLSRVSGPLLDRIDLHVEVPRLKFNEMTTDQPAESSAEVRARVNQARIIQQERFQKEKNIYCNAHMQAKHLKKYCQLTPESQELLKNAITKLNLSARAYDRILKVARTISDLDNQPQIQSDHIAEALQYRAREES